MSYTRVNIRDLVRQAIDPTSADFINTLLNTWIEECVLFVSTLLPTRQTYTNATFTGSEITLTNRVKIIESVLVDGVYLRPLHVADKGFTNGYFYGETTTDDTKITLGAAITSKAVTINYYASFLWTTTADTDICPLPDQHVHLVVWLMTMILTTMKFFKALIPGTIDLGIVSRYLTASEEGWEEFLEASAFAVAEWESQTIREDIP